MTKPAKWSVRPAKTQISLRIRVVWSVFTVRLKMVWVLNYPLSHSEDWSDWADAQADLNLPSAHRSFCWFCHALPHFKVILPQKSQSSILVGKLSAISSLQNRSRYWSETGLKEMKLAWLTWYPTQNEIQKDLLEWISENYWKDPMTWFHKVHTIKHLLDDIVGKWLLKTL